MDEPKFVKVTHEYQCLIGEDRSCKVSRAETGSFQIEWCTKDSENGFAVVCTRVVVSEEAAAATALLLSKIMAELEDKLESDQ